LSDLAGWQVAATVAILFTAFFLRGMSGFGAGLVAVPLLVFVMPIQTAVPMMTVLGFAVLVFLSVRDRRHVVWSEFRILIVPTVIGVAVGVALMSMLGSSVLVRVLALVVIAYAVYLVASPYFGGTPRPCARGWAPPAAFLSSVIDTALGSGGGALVVIYMHSRRLGRVEFRATLATLWVFEAGLRIAGYGAAGFYTSGTVLLIAAMLPVLWIGTLIGEKVGNVISPAGFSRIIAALLAGSGVALLMKSS
jgi:uncharacterized membrane protein YfcA